MPDLVKIELPFGGFYESVHDKEIDEAFEYHYSIGDWQYNEEARTKEEETQIYNAIWSADVNWDEIRNEYCKAYAEAFGDKFGLDVTFDELWSPREYNFTSDRVFCLVPREQIDKIRKEVEANEDWPEYIKERFTEQSGFIPFYSNNYKDEDWTKETLAECQYEIILRFWLDNISEEVGSEGWHMEEYYLLESIEVSNFASINKGIDLVDEYLKKEGVKISE